MRMPRTVSVACLALLITLLALPLEASARVRGVRVVADVGHNTGYMGVDANGVFYVHHNDYIGRYSLDGDKLGEIPLLGRPAPLYSATYDTGPDGAGYFVTKWTNPDTSKVYRMSPGGGELTAIYSPDDDSAANHMLGDVTVGRSFVYVGEGVSAPCDPFLPPDEPGNCYDTPPTTYLIRAVRPSGGVADSWEVKSGGRGIGSDRPTGEVYAGYQGSVERFTAGGSSLASWSIDQPVIPAIAVDGQGRVWVSSGGGGDGGALRAGIAAVEGQIQTFTQTGQLLSGAEGAPQDLVAYGGRIFALDDFDDDARIVELGDTPDLNVVANAKWRQKKQKVIVNTNCNAPCTTSVSTYLKIGKEREDLRVKRSDIFTAKRRFFKFRLSRKLRKMVTEAHARGQKVRVLAGVSARQISEFQPLGEFDYDCQVVALPRPKAKAAAKCSPADEEFIFG